jgi:hemoglobin/transferrin/lactoferrin receptor protein
MCARSVYVSVSPQAELEFKATEPRRNDPKKPRGGEPERPLSPGASGNGPLARALLLVGVSALAAGAVSEARAQDAQLPPLVVEGTKKASPKKAAAKKAPVAPAASAPAPAPVAPPVAATTTAVAPSDVPYTVPAGVSVVGSGEIGTFGQTDLGNVIRTMPGTYTRESANNPGVAVNIRGFEGSGRVNMMIDGVRQNFRFTGHEAQGFTYIDPLLLAGIEVQRGAVSTAGGAGALAGTANFRTLGVEDILKPGQAMGALSIGSWGSNGTGWAGMQAVAATNGGVGIAGAISGHNQGTYENGDGQKVPWTWQDPASGLVKADFYLNEEQSLKFGGVFYDNDFLSNSYFQHVKTNNFTAKYAYNPIDNDLINFSLNGYRSEVSMRYGTDSDPTRAPAFPPGQSLIGSSAYRVIEDDGWGWDISNLSRFHLGAVRVKSVYGYEFFFDDVNVINSAAVPNRGVNPSGKSSVDGFFSETTFSYSVFDLIAGLRYDSFSLEGSGSVTAANPLFPVLPAGPYRVDRDEGRFDPKVTLAAQVLPWLQPYVTYSESMRAPTISETLTGGDHPPTGGPPMSFFPNPFLDPEVQKGWEFGFNVVEDGLFTAADRFRFKADYFTMDVDNYITGCAANATGSAFYFCNARGKSTVEGVEVQGNYDAGFVFAGLSYTHTTTSLPPQTNGFGAQSFLPDDILILTGGFRLLQEKLTVGARGYITSKSYNGADVVPTNGDPNDPYNDGYELLDLFANYEVAADVDVGLTVSNVFDRAYTPALTTPSTDFTGELGRGRTFLVTTRAQF